MRWRGARSFPIGKRRKWGGKSGVEGALRRVSRKGRWGGLAERDQSAMARLICSASIFTIVIIALMAFFALTERTAKTAMLRPPNRFQPICAE